MRPPPDEVQQYRQKAWAPAKVWRNLLHREFSVSNTRHFVIEESHADIDGWWVLWGRAYLYGVEVPIRPENELPGETDGWPLMIRPVPSWAMADPVKFLRDEIMACLIHPWSPEIEATIRARLAAAA